MDREIDRTDAKILAILQGEGRISNVDLARQINLSPSPCLERVRRLEQDGYIRRYGAQLDEVKLGYGSCAFIQVTLDRTTADVFDKFRDAVVHVPQVA
ncbi:MAG: Lrp/AsnC family transcriptional regulator, partial [Pseudomonadota bacterium]